MSQRVGAGPDGAVCARAPIAQISKVAYRVIFHPNLTATSEPCWLRLVRSDGPHRPEEGTVHARVVRLRRVLERRTFRGFRSAPRATVAGHPRRAAQPSFWRRE